MEAKIKPLERKIKGVSLGDIMYSEYNDKFYIVSSDEIGNIYLHNLEGKNNLFNGEKYFNIKEFTNALNENEFLKLKHLSQLKYYLDITEKEEF